MRIVTGIKNMILPFCFDNRTGKHIQVLLFFGTACQHLTMIFEMYKIVSGNFIPWCPLTMPLSITPIEEIKQVIGTIFIKRDKIGSPGIGGFIKKIGCS